MEELEINHANEPKTEENTVTTKTTIQLNGLNSLSVQEETENAE